MDPFIKDIVQVAAWGVAIVGGLIAASRAINETAENRRQRGHELRWKRAQLAREILDKLLSNKRFRDALFMLDWSGREFEVSPSQMQEVRWEDLPGALRSWVEPISFDDKEIYIRDCFDELFDGMNLLEHYLRTDLLDFADIEFPMAYHVAQLRKQWEAVNVYISHYGNKLALAFVSRFPIVESGDKSRPRQATRTPVDQVAST